MTLGPRPAAQLRLRALLVLAGTVHGAAWGAVGMTLLGDDDAPAILALDGPRVTSEADLLTCLLLVAALPLGSLLGAPALDRLSHTLGRRPAVMSAAALIAVGALLPTPGGLILTLSGALAVGLGLGGLTIVLPKLAHELAAPGHRRLMPRTWAVAPVGAAGAVAAGALASLAEPRGAVVGAWAVPAVLATLVLLLATALPETPHWYTAQNRLEAAHASLVRMHGALEAAVAIDWVLLDAGTRGDQARLSRSDLTIRRVRQVVVAGLLLELVQALPLGLAALVLTPPLLAGRVPEGWVPAGPLAMLALLWGGAGLCGLLRRRAHHLAYAWVMVGTGVSVCGTVLLALLGSVGPVGDVVVLLAASTLMVAGQYVAVVPACAGGVDPLVPPWLLRSQRRAVAALRPLVQLVSVGGAVLVLALAPSSAVMLGLVLGGQLLSLLLALLALPRAVAALR
ncbi:MULTISPECIES: MFS transporter [Actinomyces]|uniref:MFS transporter n=1 Tax=Actinomyces respiraculi TaxID=2744574 RepID=A0A7T0PVM9_9ACTO|nr:MULTISPECIES: MFS transporter [Actinomyces]QPL04884.1 MFS transporter [Actinomyces respiraculi]